MFLLEKGAESFIYDENSILKVVEIYDDLNLVKIVYYNKNKKIKNVEKKGSFCERYQNNYL
ncbi:hypothetical Protein psc1_03360 [Candidatus Phytoplasma solani]|uniref:Uncharacterized protein n=1 Tax=Candidatus Phytoplasma solani TaxID=69896 RepID=A0A421NYX3_9MOLU|nr:hypothetical protein PSSA1_v1c0540 [Candidatus Phytoplasma solani]CCP88224.1 hypothetical protein S284_02870 [Candidatus Phytoplasma solani]CCP88829.1 hypothetical protein S231_03720 [Candidatus Phytoplasma solani]